MKIPDGDPHSKGFVKPKDPPGSSAGGKPDRAAGSGASRAKDSGLVPGKERADLQKAVFTKQEEPPPVLKRDFFGQAAAALGFPKDPLSTAILAFSRLFSFSLRPELIKTLRQEILSSGKLSAPENTKEQAALEASVMARVIALDKGVVLSPEALERFTCLLAPPALPENEDLTAAQPAVKNDSGGEKEERPGEEEVPAADKIKAIAEKQAKQDRLLQYMNAIPGKNGQYWMVFPFKIRVRDTEIKVIIRLLKKELFSSQDVEHFIVDISGQKKQWRFFLGKTAGRFRADIRVFPEYNAGAIKKEAEALLGIDAKKGRLPGPGNFRGFEEIRILKGEEMPSWVDDLCTGRLFYVNKEV